ncbi:sentrin-specific protease 5 [Bombina bombina]|uniref:sentrin-specific protease 5 n=1 Tax=Bombina bombina TaxID=8345 RepID=UPI00235B2C85|nr:sentrin-specific protease 5 [Bombina bombina]
MKHRKALHRKRSRLLLSQPWMTQFGGSKTYCFFQKRWPVFSRQRQIKFNGRVNKVGICKSKECSNTTHRKERCPRLTAIPQNVQKSLKKHNFKRRAILNFALKPSIQSKELGNSQSTKHDDNRKKKWKTTSDVLSNDPVTYSIDHKNISVLQTKEKLQLSKRTNERKGVLVIFNSHRKIPSHLLKQKCFGGLCFKRINSLFSSRKVPLFMMHKKLSVFTSCGRIQSHNLRTINRSFKLAEKRHWFQNICRNSLRGKINKAASYLKSKLQRPIQNISRLSDMNNTSGILCAKQLSTSTNCLRDETVKLQNVESQLADIVTSKPILKYSPPQHHEATIQWQNNAPAPKKINENHTVNRFSDDICVLLPEKEISISCQEVTSVQAENDAEALLLLAPDKVQLCMGENTECPMDLVENGDDTCHMDVEESTNADVFNTKLLDHPYCKSPPQHHSAEGAQNSSEKERVKNGQKIISSVSDERLASCLCGLLNDIIKKYGSLIPLSERDVLTRLKEVFNEDFSSRTSFITKEIMKYRAKHSKAPVCNFRVFYNKHMLVMDDLATLDGHNWLNDQVINMYGELIMDAVPEKVHFLNSFFHRQLVTKGYNGVKRWTKKVDFFKKTLLLIPIHLEVHWSLITVNIPNKIISFYDSQGIHFKFCVEMTILKCLRVLCAVKIAKGALTL